MAAVDWALSRHCSASFSIFEVSEVTVSPASGEQVTKKMVTIPSVTGQILAEIQTKAPPLLISDHLPSTWLSCPAWTMRAFSLTNLAFSPMDSFTCTYSPSSRRALQAVWLFPRDHFLTHLQSPTCIPCTPGGVCSLLCTPSSGIAPVSKLMLEGLPPDSLPWTPPASAPDPPPTAFRASPSLHPSSAARFPLIHSCAALPQGSLTPIVFPLGHPLRASPTMPYSLCSKLC